MELYDSVIRVTYDPDGVALVLIDIGTPLWSPLLIDGGQVVEPQQFVRAAGIKARPRGNEQHSLRFEKAGIAASIDDAFADYANGCVSLPRGMADILFTLSDDRSWRLKNCAVQSWSGGLKDSRINSHVIEIIGGQLMIDEGIYIPGQTWGEISMNWEDLG